MKWNWSSLSQSYEQMSTAGEYSNLTRGRIQPEITQWAHRDVAAGPYLQITAKRCVHQNVVPEIWVYLAWLKSGLRAGTTLLLFEGCRLFVDVINTCCSENRSMRSSQICVNFEKLAIPVCLCLALSGTYFLGPVPLHPFLFLNAIDCEFLNRIWS